MTPAFEHECFSLEGNTLLVSGKTLGWGDRETFSVALQELMKTDEPKLVVDLSRVDYMSSSYVGPLTAVVMEAKDGGREVTILAGKRTAVLLDTSGIGEYAEVRMVSE